MTTKLEEAIAVVKTLSSAAQKRIVETIDFEAAQTQDYQLTADDHHAIDEGIAAADAGDFASDEEVAMLFARFQS